MAVDGRHTSFGSDRVDVLGLELGVLSVGNKYTGTLERDEQFCLRESPWED